MMRLLLLFGLAFTVALAVLGAPAIGCPVCDTAAGEQVRAGILDESFSFNLFATLLPFPILVVVVALIHFRPPARKG